MMTLLSKSDTIISNLSCLHHHFQLIVNGVHGRRGLIVWSVVPDVGKAMNKETEPFYRKRLTMEPNATNQRHPVKRTAK